MEESAVVEFLTKEGVKYDDLCVVMVMGDIIVGEVAPTQFDRLVGTPVMVSNPKRLLRVQRARGQEQISVEFVLGDYDLIEKGKMQVLPTHFFRLSWLSPQSRLNYLLLYAQYLERKKMSAALDAGLILPQMHVTSNG
jgi:hypothetical protein